MTGVKTTYEWLAVPYLREHAEDMYFQQSMNLAQVFAEELMNSTLYI